MTDNYLASTDKYIQGFRKKKQRNARKVWGILIILMLFTSLFTFLLIDYMSPIPIDPTGFRINYYLLLVGLLYQLILSFIDNSYGDKPPLMAGVVPPSRRQPLFGKNLRRIREHHPRNLSPFLPPILLTHILIWLIAFFGGVLVSVFIPGEVRKWRRYLIKYGGFSLSIGSLMYLIFTVIAIKWNFTLLSVNIINSLFIGLSIPGMAALFYTIGTWIASNFDTPAKTIIGGLILLLLWIIPAFIIPYFVIERIIFSLLFKLAAGFWLILLFLDIRDHYYMHKV